MNEQIEKIVELVIDDDNLNEEMLEDTGVDIISFVDAPAIKVGFLHFNEQHFVEPRAGESEDDFIGRCMGELKNEYPDEEQRLAVCYSYFEGSIQEDFETYNDYPEGAKNNACRAIKWAEENGWGSCGTDVGKQRAHQLCKGENISKDTIARMASFARHEQHKDVPYTEGCGGLMWDAWGGSSGINWAQSKLKQLEELSCEGSCETELLLSEEQQKVLLDFCEDDNNGEYITKDDIFIDLTKNEFAGIGDVITAIRSLDILKRLTIKREQKPETYWRYSGPPAQRDFCKAMMRLSNAGKIFTQKEIDRMTGLNSQFAKKGQSSYSIFQWVGGKNCKHWWEKLSIFKSDDGTKVIIAGNPKGRKETNATRPWREKMSFSIDEEKRIVMGAVMVPNKMILRRDENGNPYYIYFTKKTIRKMAEKFFKLNKHNNTDINHDENITTENTLIESWISESIKHDKSYKYGFALPEGTWYVSYKINNDETWKKIKSGELKGFSLSGGFLQKMKPIDSEKTLNDIKDILKQVEQ